MSDSVELVAVALPGPAAARAVVAAWESGEAVLVLDPAAPAPELARALAAAKPTQLLDGDGRRRLPHGEPVEPGVAALVATSGTSGIPKVVELGADAIAWSARAVSAALGSGPGDRWLCCLPVHGVAGLAVIARAWHAGLPLEVHDRFDPAAVRAAAGRATLVSLVPTMLRRLLAGGGEAARFRRVLLGGSPIPADLAEAATTRGVDLVRSYGLTETFGGMVHDGHPLPGAELRVGGVWTTGATLSAAGLPSRLGARASAGRGAGRAAWSDPESEARPDLESEARSHLESEARSNSPRETRSHPPSETRSHATEARSDPEGEVLVRGPMLFRRYRGDPERTAAVLQGGWLRTGDLGRLGRDGRLTVLGRLDDLVISGGVNVHPDEVEAALAAHPAVAEVAVAGRPDPEWGERVAAFVVPADPAAPPTLAGLRAFALERLAPAKAPRELVLVAALPRAPSGKLLRRLLPEPAAQDLPAGKPT
jgi:acyl-CoA synthetase (AMP-forming)/AMP-acid ligase II